MELHNSSSFNISKLLTKTYSTSFSLGIAAFSPSYRNAIYSIYGFVRIADEIVDTFHEFNQKELMKNFREETDRVLNSGISTNPILHSFVITVNEFGIDRKYIDAFLNSMEMDLYNNYYDKNEYDEYIYGSAEVVGLMCLQVFCGNNKKLFNDLIEPARALGSAFQKVNFLRDIRSDIDERGRVYLPGISKEVLINDENKIKLEDEVESEFQSALQGIKKLPNGVKLGVYSAYLYYLILFKKIRRLRIKELMKQRVRVSNVRKMALLLRSVILVKFLKIN